MDMKVQPQNQDRLDLDNFFRGIVSVSISSSSPVRRKRLFEYEISFSPYSICLEI